MIRSFLFTQSGQVQPIEIEQIEAVLGREDNFIWLDLVSEPVETCRPILRDVFKFHPLSIDDALLETHVPKVDEVDIYLYLVLRAVKTERRKIYKIDTPELDIFLGSNYLVTYQSEPLAAVDKIWELCHQDHRYLSRGVGYLLYQIADEIVTNTMEAVDDLNLWIDQIEDEIFLDPQPETLEHILSIKRIVLRLRLALLPQREVFNKLARGDFELILKDDRIYYRDVYDHMLRLQEINEGLRDLITGALDTYLSVVNNRMNDVMKMLTIITTLFMPLSFLTGFFGMNFFQAVIPRDAWTGVLSFLLVLASMILIPAIMYLWMHRRGWM